MKSKFNICDVLKDTITGYTGAVVSITFNGNTFLYQLATQVDARQNFTTESFIELRLELADTTKNRIGFGMETS